MDVVDILDETSSLEQRILSAIKKIKGNRNRACFQNILTFFNRSKPNIDMDKLKNVLADMESKRIVKNNGEEGKETFFINTAQEDSNVDNNNIAASTDIDEFISYIDDNFYNVLVNKIKSEVKSAVKHELKQLEHFNDLTVIKKAESIDSNNASLYKFLVKKYLI